MMYEIYVRSNGTCACCGRLQDGTERWEEPTIETAYKSMKLFAKIMNNTKIKKKNIAVFDEKPVQKVDWVPREYVPYKPSRS